MNAEQPGDFVYHIATVTLDKAVVGVTFSPAEVALIVGSHRGWFGRLRINLSHLVVPNLDEVQTPAVGAEIGR